MKINWRLVGTAATVFAGIVTMIGEIARDKTMDQAIEEKLTERQSEEERK